MDSNTSKPQESKPKESKPQESKPKVSKPQESKPCNNGNRNNDEYWSPKYQNRWVPSTGPVAFTLSSLKSYLVFLFLFFSNLFSLLWI
jgi:hypothetical protein